jgi:phenylpropionate dioxygenase-like ring-hydroxylating dioxygenase large terminal subunit
MTDPTLELINRSMDEQVASGEVPRGFPDFPEIPAARYVDQGFADLEMRHIWEKAWLFAGVENDLPEAGSYFLFERLGRSIIVSRGKDGAIRAFHNVCRHRGSALLTEPAGQAMRFICPYHSWGYQLTGELTSVPLAHDFPCLDKSERGLVPVRCETFRSLIYISMDPEAQSLETFLAPIAASIEGFPLDDLVTKEFSSYAIESNWKIALHNFLEIYHVNTVHPTSLAPYFDTPSYFISLFANGHSRLATRRRQGKSLMQNDRQLKECACETFSELSIAPAIFPNIFTALDLSGFGIMTFWPDGADKCVLHVQTVAWRSSPADEGYWEAFGDRGREILMEDKRLFPTLQRSMASGAIRGIKLGYQERAPYWFEEEVDRMIGPENIPEHMRVVQVLSGYMAAAGGV